MKIEKSIVEEDVLSDVPITSAYAHHSIHIVYDVNSMMLEKLTSDSPYTTGDATADAHEVMQERWLVESMRRDLESKKRNLVISIAVGLLVFIFVFSLFPFF